MTDISEKMRLPTRLVATGLNGRPFVLRCLLLLILAITNPAVAACPAGVTASTSEYSGCNANYTGECRDCNVPMAKYHAAVRKITSGEAAAVHAATQPGINAARMFTLGAATHMSMPARTRARMMRVLELTSVTPAGVASLPIFLVPVANSNTNLATLALSSSLASSVAFSPAFGVAAHTHGQAYETDIDFATSTATAAATAASQHSTVVVTGKGALLAVSQNTATVRVTAESSQHAILSAKVTRLPNSGATLAMANFTVADVTLSPTFTGTTAEYTALYPNAVSTVVQTKTADANAIVSATDGNTTSASIGATAQYAYEVPTGSTVLAVTVTAQDGSTAVDYVTVCSAVLLANSTSVSTGSGMHALAVGDSSFSIQVTAEDGTTTQTCTLTVTRPADTDTRDTALSFGAGVMQDLIQAASTTVGFVSTQMVSSEMDTLLVPLTRTSLASAALAPEWEDSAISACGAAQTAAGLYAVDLTVPIMAEDGATTTTYSVAVTISATAAPTPTPTMTPMALPTAACIPGYRMSGPTPQPASYGSYSTSSPVATARSVA